MDLPSSPSSIAPRRLGQAWYAACTLSDFSTDREQKKIKCDGALPACRNCAKAGIPCEASEVLQRNTRVRGFVPDQVQDLKAQLAYCQQALQAERDAVSVLRQQLAQQLPPGPSAVQPNLGPPSLPPPSPTAPSPDVFSRHAGSTLLGSLSRQSTDTAPNSSAYVIKHMGRMVLDPAGVGRFAGSITGVHFVLGVEEACKRVLHFEEAFPEGCYNLYLGQPTNGPGTSRISRLGISVHDPNEDILAHLQQPISFYAEQVQLYVRNWEAFCPVLAGEQLIGEIEHLVKKVHDGCNFSLNDESSLCILFAILGINDFTGRVGSDSILGARKKYISLFERMQCGLVARADISSLQALVLIAFYHQLTGRSLSLIQLNGHMVRVAQSLGLHRHARRFRLKAAEVELRKRIWWWLYAFDRITSIVHGLPALISDIDVDNDMPTDCQLRSLEDTELIHPLPGQTTPIFSFNHYAAMGKKMSSILDSLYTTTQRRLGAAKIERLDRDMRESTPEFASCLIACVGSSTEIIRLLNLAASEATCFLYLLPIGPGPIFHCALMHVYCQCKARTPPFGQTAGLPTVNESVDTIFKAVDILERYHQQESSHGSSEIGNSFYLDAISATIKTLRNLISLLLQPSFHPSTDNESWPSDTALGAVPYSPFGANSLYDLNHMTAMDWAQDITDTFGYLPDLGG
ncbi:Zn(II)2Cys6 transcription factor [Aspergillus stella-maris]|uniref:Zn(II)2Cys6 transcription factor n=1 Tax=Aspergillus stella-maris TaxID=1810926 RepID=UPI003CCD0A85